MADRYAAQVLLAPGADPAADADRARQAFTALGFELGALAGGHFAIQADAARFAHVFGVRLHARPDGGVDVHDAKGQALKGLLPLQQLPASLRPLIADVLFTEPPAFGPGSFS